MTNVTLLKLAPLPNDAWQAISPKALPLSSYIDSDLVLDLDQALVPRIDMGPNLTLGPILLSMQRLMDWAYN